MISHSITRTLSLLGAIISLIIAVLIPMGYFITAYQYMGGSMNAEIELSARAIEGLIVNNPDSWQFEEVRLQEILQRRLNHDILETRTIRDLQGSVIAQSKERLVKPVAAYSQPIYDAGAQVAHIEIMRSIFPLIARTTALGACSALIGILIFLAFRSFPLRAVRQAYRVLEEKEERLKLALTSGRFGVWDWDIDKNVMIWDDRMYEIFGISRDSVKKVFEAWQNGVHPEDRERVLEDVRARIVGEKEYHMGFRIVRPDGTVRYIKTDGAAVRGINGKPMRIIGLYDDITDRKRGEEMLRENEARLDLALKSAHMGVWHWDIIENKRHFDGQVCRFLGIDPVTFTGAAEEFFHAVHPDDNDAVKAALVRTMEQDAPYEVDYRALWPDGSSHYITARGTLVRDETGRPVKLNGIIWDITPRKLAEEAVKTSLYEKEVLLKEIHHRVKNNLQVISSLLNMQSQHIYDPRDVDVFKTSMDRVKSMALIHDKLYRSENLASIFFPAYVNDLVRGLLVNYSTGKDVDLNLRIDPVSFEIDNAIPLGLIINELVANALKHAFPDGKQGRISVGLHREGIHAVLLVSDNGIGFPPDIDFRDTQSMGMQLVVTLVEQLDGTIELSGNEGTEFRIVFETVP